MSTVPITLLIDEHPRQWNAWREAHRDTAIELDGVDLSGKSLFGVNLSGATLVGATLVGADLTDADLYRAYLSGADLSEATFSGATLTGANLGAATATGTNFTDAILTRATLNSAKLSKADFTGANLTEASLFGTKLPRATFANANLTGANLVGVVGDHTVLDGANLTGAHCTGADLTHANLTHGDLTDANLTHVNLSDANLTRAALFGTTLDGAVLTGATLDGTNLTHTDMTHVDLTDALTTRAIGVSDPVTEPLVLPDGALGAIRFTIDMRSAASPEDLADVIAACGHLCDFAARSIAPPPRGAILVTVANIRYQSSLRVDLIEHHKLDEGSDPRAERPNAPGLGTAAAHSSRVIRLLKNLTAAEEKVGVHEATLSAGPAKSPRRDTHIRHRFEIPQLIDPADQRCGDEPADALHHLVASLPQMVPLFSHRVTIDAVEPLSTLS